MCRRLEEPNSEQKLRFFLLLELYINIPGGSELSDHADIQATVADTH